MMKKISPILVISLMLVLLLADGVLSQGGRGRRIHYNTLFDPGTVQTVSGEVVRVERVLCANGRDHCVHGVLKTPKGRLTAVLAPSRYLAQQGLTIAPKDRVTVTGSLIYIMGKPFLLVTEMTGDRTMKLRDKNGRPAWAIGDDWHAH